MLRRRRAGGNARCDNGHRGRIAAPSSDRRVRLAPDRRVHLATDRRVHLAPSAHRGRFVRRGPSPPCEHVHPLVHRAPGVHFAARSPRRDVRRGVPVRQRLSGASVVSGGRVHRAMHHLPGRPAVRLDRRGVRETVHDEHRLLGRQLLRGRRTLRNVRPLRGLRRVHRRLPDLHVEQPVLEWTRLRGERLRDVRLEQPVWPHGIVHDDAHGSAVHMHGRQRLRVGSVVLFGRLQSRAGQRMRIRSSGHRVRDREGVRQQHVWPVLDVHRLQSGVRLRRS